MLFLLFLLLFYWLHFLLGFGFLSVIAVCIWVWYVINLFKQVNHRIAFREFILVLYGLNYLFSPALSYYLNDQSSPYRMEIDESDYFQLVIPAILFFHFGLYSIKSKIFTIDFSMVHTQILNNKSFLVLWIYIGVALHFISSFVPSDFAFFLYLLSSIRFVAAFGLFALDKRRYKWHLFAIVGAELVISLNAGMFHDFVMWLTFFVLFWFYQSKPSQVTKIFMATIAILSFFVLQVTKSEYRKQTWEENRETGFVTFQEAVEKNANTDGGIFTMANFTSSLSRVNQAWILASTVKRMDMKGDYQQMEIVKKYAEAAFMPRFLAPDKLKAGDKEIFNKFSGHRISQTTSMGLGMLADGYVAYGSFGTILFAFCLGVIFSLIFKFVEKWSGISPFFVLFIFPILNYAVRPDCETQTIMGHIVKGLIVFGMLTWYYKSYFRRRILTTRGTHGNVDQMTVSGVTYV